jgi:predicted ribosomally synthesized peptide with SipW-like signal peptide
MKKKMLLMMLALTVSVALIVGATMAWFTAEDETKDAVFKTGTVEIKAKGAKPLGEKGIKNVNPGDCYILEYNIKNTGSKQIDLRAIFDLNWLWKDGYPALSLDNVFVIPHQESNWVLYQPEEDGENDTTGPENSIYAYYRGDPVNPKEEVTLHLVVYFDGGLTNDDYQNRELKVSGVVEAVQHSHDAASEVWGDAWDKVINTEYAFTYEGWELKELDLEKYVPCYTANLNPEDPGEDPGEEPEPDPEDPELANFEYEVIVEHRCNYTKITVNFSNAKDRYGNAFTGEQQYNLRYRTKINWPPYSEEFTEEDFTVVFDENGNATFTKVLEPSNRFVNRETTTVEKVVPPADE